MRRFVRIFTQRILLKTALNCVLRIKIFGKENLQKINAKKPLIIVANHASHFDAPLIVTNLPQKLGTRIATAAAADYFFKNIKSAKLTRIFFNTYPVDRDGSKINRGLSGEIIAAKIPMLIFPEGTRSRNGELGKFHLGAARLTIENKAQILPISLSGNFEAWPASDKFWHKGRPKVKVIIHSPISPNKNETETQLTSRVKNIIAADLCRSDN